MYTIRLHMEAPQFPPLGSKSKRKKTQSLELMLRHNYDIIIVIYDTESVNYAIKG